MTSETLEVISTIDSISDYPGIRYMSGGWEEELYDTDEWKNCIQMYLCLIHFDELLSFL